MKKIVMAATETSKKQRVKQRKWRGGEENISMKQKKAWPVDVLL